MCPLSKLILIRHAQASWRADDYDVLSELGREQSLLLGRFFADIGIRFDDELEEYPALALFKRWLPTLAAEDPKIAAASTSTPMGDRGLERVVKLVSE